MLRGLVGILRVISFAMPLLVAGQPASNPDCNQSTSELRWSAELANERYSRQPCLLAATSFRDVDQRVRNVAG